MQDFTDQIAAIRVRLGEAAGYLRVSELELRQPQLEAEASRPDLWDDQDKARLVTSELAAVNEDLDLYVRLAADVEDAETYPVFFCRLRLPRPSRLVEGGHVLYFFHKGVMPQDTAPQRPLAQRREVVLQGEVERERRLIGTRIPR